MSVIDRQGRVFGRWNLIDLFVAAFVLALAPMGYFGLRVAAERRAQITAAKRLPAPIMVAPPRVTAHAEAAPLLPPPCAPPVVRPDTAAHQEVVDWAFLDVETMITVDSVKAAAWLKPGVRGAARSDSPATVVQSVRAVPGADHPELIVRFRVACRRVDAALVCAEEPLRLGAPFTFSAKGWTVSGSIVALALDGDAHAAP